ncbi:riboflavin synthase [Orrella sp. JC864]|uniref:riboflavin synthase n=1 Tax=Orrella sp. JC864 TaxID=3120298 RepID=UPI003009FCDD
MFTGIVAAVGRVTEVQPLPGGSEAGVRLRIAAGALDLSDVRIGDSIAVQGACMTVVARTDDSFEVEVSRESLNRTSGLAEKGEVNLEKSLRVGDYLGGHLVSGHVDGQGEVLRFSPVGESHELLLHAPKPLARYLAYKGSITVNGVSLTVNSIDDGAEGCDFSINLIPHTVAATTLKHLKPGDRVNLEVDTIARYVERMLGGSHSIAVTG